MNMGTLIILAMVGIPCVAFLIFCATSNGKNWLAKIICYKKYSIKIGD